MAFNVYETTYSRSTNQSFDRASATLEFVGFFTLDDSVARAGFITYLAANFPTFYGLLYKDHQVSPVGGGFWKCTVQYESYVTTSNPAQGGASPPPPPPPAPASTAPLGPEYSWDISNATEHVVRSIDTINSSAIDLAGAATTARDHNQAIAVVEKTGEVQGCDRIYGKAELSITKLFDYITLDYYKTCLGLVGTVNNATFYSFSAGEVLFLGCSGQPRDNGGKVAITFKFAVALNETAIVPVYGLLVDKEGWEYLWVSFREKVVSSKKVSEPYAYYIEQIYKKKNFALLGIGV